jgi:hypothetical protein
VLAIVAVALVVGVALTTHFWVYGTRQRPRDSARVLRTRRAWVLRASVAACAAACLALFFARATLAPMLGVRTLQGLFLTCTAIGLAIMYGALPPQRDL